MIEIILHKNNERLYSNSSFSYTRQIGDVGDLSVSTTNYTNSFTIPKNQDSIQKLDGFGVVGSDARTPYEIIKCTVLYNSIEVISDGTLVITETNNSFKANVQDGNVDFWKAIENLTLGQIDLSEAEHQKNFNTILDFFENGTSKKYKYLVADYGGDFRITFRSIVGDQTGYRINADHLMPSIPVKYILDQIFSFIGFQYNIPFEIPLYWTYPKSDADATQLAENFTEISFTGDIANWNAVPFSPEILNDGAVLTGSGHITNLERGYYRIDLTSSIVDAIYDLDDRRQPGRIISVNLPIKINIKINDTDYLETVSSVLLSENDSIKVQFTPLSDEEVQTAFGYGSYDVYRVRDLHAGNLRLKVNKYIFENVDFSDALAKTSVKDFIKEVMYLYGLTLNVKHKKANFYTINERLNYNIVDLSNRLKEVSSEKYTYNNYAKKNILKHKYVDANTGYNDAEIRINNENLKPEYVILESSFFTPTQYNIYKMFDSETKENEYGDVEVEYKGISDRSFVLNSTKRLSQITLFSKKEELEEIVPLKIQDVGIQRDSNFRQLYNEYYSGFHNILDDAKIIKVDLDISLIEMTHLDLMSRIYINKSNYIINKLMYRNDRVSAELIRVKNG